MTPQNLLIRMSDQNKARMTWCAGHPLAKISNLDAPAVRGTRFVDTQTLPSRRSKCLAADKTTSICPGGEDWRKSSILL
jgi:hypothetical protein